MSKCRHCGGSTKPEHYAGCMNEGEKDNSWVAHKKQYPLNHPWRTSPTISRRKDGLEAQQAV